MKSGWITLFPAATLFLTGIAGTPVAYANEKEHHKHQKVTMAEVPQPAKDALTREAKGAALTNLRKEEHKGVTYYEADVVENGKRVEIMASADGTDVKREKEEHAEHK
jgi:hypothetical protein